MTVVAAVVLLSAVVGATAVTGAAAPAAASSSTSPHDNGIGTNYTVSLPNEKSHQPGATSADIRHYSAANGLFQKTSSPKGFKRMDTLTIWSEDIVFGTCSTENTKAFGIDRDNDDPGTKTDEGLLQHRKDSAFNEHSIYVNFFGQGALAGSPVELHNEDQIVAAQDGCYGMPSKPGWYQINARINGTGYNGNYIDSKDQGTIRSHYFYVCDCSSREQAVEKLGPPPSKDGSGDNGSGDNTATATATPTATPRSGDNTATATSAGDESTPTTTRSSGPGESTPTATQPSRGGRTTPTTTGTSTSRGNTTTATGAGTATGGTTGGTTTTGGTGGNASGGGQRGSGGTPTQGSGPGFGVAAALVALLGATLLAARRRD